MMSQRHLPRVLLTVALVVQAMVAVLPHQHGATAVDGARPNIDESAAAHHGCLACSVHAPVIDVPVAGVPLEDGTVSSPLSNEGSPGSAIVGVFSIRSRGPPPVV
jgi:hypothetical protein